MPSQIPLTFALSLLMMATAAIAQVKKATPPPSSEPTRVDSVPRLKSSTGEPARDAAVEPAQAKTPERTPPGPVQSGAEQVTLLRRAIESAQARILELKTDLESPESEYAEAQAAFDEADQLLEKHKKAIAESGESSGAIDAETERLTKSRALAKERFDLAIENRRVATEQLATLQQKLKTDRLTLDRLEGREPPQADPASAETPKAESKPAPTTEPASSATNLNAAVPQTADSATAPASSGESEKPEASKKNSETAAEAKTDETEKRPESRQLTEAKANAATKARDSQRAETEARSLTERLETLDRDIALEGKRLETARRQRDNATATREELTAAFREKSLKGVPKTELDESLRKVREAESRLREVGEDVKQRSQLLEELHAQRAAVQAERIAALKTADAAREQARLADESVARLKNPLNPRNMLNWLFFHGPSILTIVVAMFIGHQLSKMFSQRVILLLSRDGARGSQVEREARARTLIGVFHNTASMAIFVGGGLMILQESGIPIAPLLGGAAVFGLAVAFGAQNLIRDYFYGFVILLENQYKLNDVVRIGTVSGQVENITLRMTVLRDLEGQVHFIPNGQITSVTNMTHGWSRAVFDIAVAYRENVDRAIAVLTQLAADLRLDPVLGPAILEEPTMLGVDRLDESGVVIKFHVKTRPLQQWAIKRELLRRIKNRFDELGIEIPTPHRTLIHRVEPGSGMSLPGEAPGRPAMMPHEGHKLWTTK